jgi:hypothetical protein
MVRHSLAGVYTRPAGVTSAAFPKLYRKARNQAVAEFLMFCMWVDWAAGIAPCPTRWPYKEYDRGMVGELLERVRFQEEEPGA